MKGSDQHHAPNALPFGEKIVVVIHSCLARSEEDKKPIAPAGIRTPDRPTHSLPYTDNKSCAEVLHIATPEIW